MFKISGYTKRIIKPAEKAELISVAKAMHEDKFGERVQELFAVSITQPGFAEVGSAL